MEAEIAWKIAMNELLSVMCCIDLVRAPLSHFGMVEIQPRAFIAVIKQRWEAGWLGEDVPRWKVDVIDDGIEHRILLIG